MELATIIDWQGDWEEIVPVIEKAVQEGEILEINMSKDEWMRLKYGEMKKFKSRFSEMAASRFQLLWTPNGRNFLFVENGKFR